jgi:histidine ammonia-lyase
MSLPLLGEGTVYYEGREMPTSEALEALGSKGWSTHELAAKEGLALLNGTQFMSAHAVFAILHARRLDYIADFVGALSTAAHDGRIEPFGEAVNATRPQKGQVVTAARIKGLLEDCPIMHEKKAHVQDPYSFRCMPQVHGASKNALWHAMDVVGTEVDAATDNPVVVESEDAVISAGNFHGQPLALVMDYMAIALAELGSISERRTYQLISGRRGLPPFLTPNPGLNSGLMIAQYTAAGIVSQNKQLATPASVDSVESSNGQEDHVSMGANAATKLIRVVDNLYRILAVEALNASQAASLRGAALSPRYNAWLESFRSVVPVVENDRYLHEDLVNADQFLRALVLNEEELI